MGYKILLFITSLIIIASCDTNVKESNKSISTTLTELEKEQYLSKGKEIIIKTGETLTQELKSKINEGGIETAINYCNVAALPLTDSIAGLYNVKVRRVSDKIRNPANTPDSLESHVISEYKVLLGNGDALQAMLLKENGSIRFMAPIFVNDLCLKCHGAPGENILSDDAAIIRLSYPNDHAIDYKVGDLRGIWSVTFSE